MSIQRPTLEAIQLAHQQLSSFIVKTPTLSKNDFFAPESYKLNFKYELFQNSGTFKARGAFSNLLSLSPEQKAAGVTCVSAGNHAVAVAYAAYILGIKAKVVMIKTASPARVQLVQQYGAEIVLADNGAEAFEAVHQLEQQENLVFIHPFDGYHTILGTGTLAYEWLSQVPDLEAVIIPIGGGGLAAGMSHAIKLINPNCLVFGVEPEGATGMLQSIQANHPLKVQHLQSIADSLMAPHTEAYSFAICRDNIDEFLTVSDSQTQTAMHGLFNQLKLAVEPACAVATAAVSGPLHSQLKDKKVGVLLCGTNTDLATFTTNLTRTDLAN